MDVSAGDRDLMIRTVLAEAGPKASPVEQAAISHVILNRVGRGGFGDSVGQVVLAPHQFEPWGLRRNAANHPLGFDAKSPAYAGAAQVVDGVLSGKTPDPTGGADHFLQPETVQGRVKSGSMAWPSWAKGNGLRIGQHAFYSVPSKDDDLLNTFYGPDKAADAAPGPNQSASPQAPPVADNKALLDEFYPANKSPATQVAGEGGPAAPKEPPSSIPQSTVPEAIPSNESIPVHPELAKTYQWAQQNPGKAAALGASLPLAMGAGEALPVIPMAASAVSGLAARAAPLAAKGAGLVGLEEIFNNFQGVRSLYGLIKGAMSQ